MQDGARNALIGYLYQLLGTAALCIRWVSDGDDAWASLTAEDDALHVEEYGQDAILRPPPHSGRTARAIQFKYSTTERSEIAPQELKEILLRFDASRREALADGVFVGRYELVTNRVASKGAQKILDEGRGAARPRGLLLRDGEKPKWLEPYDGDPVRAANAWHSVLRDLSVHRPASFEGQLDELRQFSKQYGVLDDEWKDRVNGLVGLLVAQTATGLPVDLSRRWLKGQIAGDADAVSLTFGVSQKPRIADSCQKQLLERLEDNHSATALRYYVPREAQRKIRDELAKWPLVLVYGQGGCGKSLAVGKYLQSVSDRQLVWSTPASHASEREVVEAFTRLRLPASGGIAADRSMRHIRARLDIANPGDRLLWIIDLDGVDEVARSPCDLRAMIKLCWNRGDRDSSPASLILTCRSQTTEIAALQIVSYWLDTAEPRLVKDRIGLIAISDFSDEELVQAATMRNGPAERRIVRALDPGLSAMMGDRDHRETSVPDHLLRSLRHPVVWGHYAELDDDQRCHVLDCDAEWLGQLAERLRCRFILRCTKRRPCIEPEGVRHALSAVARATAHAQQHPVQEFQRSCDATLGSGGAEWLRHECLTYGLILNDSADSWRWAHRFFVEYLATAREGGVCV
jgi:hypothetical protein